MVWGETWVLTSLQQTQSYSGLSTLSVVSCQHKSSLTFSVTEIIFKVSFDFFLLSRFFQKNHIWIFRLERDIFNIGTNWGWLVGLTFGSGVLAQFCRLLSRPSVLPSLCLGSGASLNFLSLMALKSLSKVPSFQAKHSPTGGTLCPGPGLSVDWTDP